MTHRLKKQHIDQDDIRHLNRSGNFLFRNPVHVTSSIHVFSNNQDYPELLTQLEEVKKQFVLVTKVFPVQQKTPENYHLQNTSVPVCYKMTSEIFRLALGLIDKYRDACQLLEKRVAVWVPKVDELTKEIYAFLATVLQTHEEFEQLYDVCKGDIQREGFFLARTKFHKSMAKHGELMDRFCSLRDAAAELREKLENAAYLVQYADRLSGFLTVMHLYLLHITAKDDIRCEIEKIYNSGYLCASHEHNKIKKEYHKLIGEINAAPNVSCFLQKSAELFQNVRYIEQQTECTHVLLHEDYVNLLFRVQKWIHGYITKRESALTGEYLFD